VTTTTWTSLARLALTTGTLPAIALARPAAWPLPAAARLASSRPRIAIATGPVAIDFAAAASTWLTHGEVGGPALREMADRSREGGSNQAAMHGAIVQAAVGIRLIRLPRRCTGRANFGVTGIASGR
jgi:hypothetical protein